MSWLREWWDKIVRDFIWQQFLSHFQWFDWIVLAVLVAGIVYGIKKGFWKTFSDILKLSLMVSLTIEYDDLVGRFLSRSIGIVPSAYMPTAAYVLLGIFLWFFFTAVFGYLKKIFSTATSPMMRFLGGMVLGLFYSLLFFSFFAQIPLMLPYEKAKEPFARSGSFTGEYVVRLAPEVHYWMIKPFRFLESFIRKPS